uniref:Lipocalin-like protein 2 n=1 Tax=Pristhesancus plagipennis TaxID=1955184 RepID=A0A1Q1NP51_PRIPG|nr:lipocalin-like protein 2 [Pristhesancus plagipennis]
MFKMNTYLLFLFVSLIGLASSKTGWCPEPNNSAKVVWTEFFGTWYEYASYGDGTTRTFYKCMKYTFTPTTETSVDALRSYEFKLFSIAGSSSYTIQPESFSDFLMKGEGFATKNIVMWLIDTDYNNYAILWSCKDNLGMFYTQTSWILTRNQTESLNKEVQSKLETVLNDHKMSWSDYGSVTQSGC